MAETGAAVNKRFCADLAPHDATVSPVVAPGGDSVTLASVKINWTPVATAVLSLFCACKPADSSGPPRASGTIETDETHLASRYGGRVEAVLAAEGNALTNGQVIVELAAPELRAARAQAAATLAEWEAGPRPQELAAARSEWEAAAAELDFARTDARRAGELFATKTISATEHDRAVSRVNVLEKNVAAAQSRYDLLNAGTRPERLAQMRARLNELDEQLRELRVSAPTNGVLEVLAVKIGDVLPPNREVATLLLIDHLWIRVFVPAPSLGAVPLGQSVKLRVDTFPDREFSGVVEQVNRAAEFTPRNVQTVGDRLKQVYGVKVRLDNREGRMRPGMTAEVILPEAPK